MRTATQLRRREGRDEETTPPHLTFTTGEKQQLTAAACTPVRLAVELHLEITVPILMLVGQRAVNRLAIHQAMLQDDLDQSPPFEGCAHYVADCWSRAQKMLKSKLMELIISISEALARKCLTPSS